MRVCYVCACVRVCEPVHLCAGTPHFSFLFLVFALLASAASAVSCLYHTVPQAVKLSTLAATVHKQSHVKLFLL